MKGGWVHPGTPGTCYQNQNVEGHTVSGVDLKNIILVLKKEETERPWHNATYTD